MWVDTPHVHQPTPARPTCSQTSSRYRCRPGGPTNQWTKKNRKINSSNLHGNDGLVQMIFLLFSGLQQLIPLIFQGVQGVRMWNSEGLFLDLQATSFEIP